MNGQDAGEDHIVVDLDARLFFEGMAQLAVVFPPCDVQRLVALAARAHQLGAHPLRYIVFEAKWRYSGWHCRDIEIQFSHHHNHGESSFCFVHSLILEDIQIEDEVWPRRLDSFLLST